MEIASDIMIHCVPPYLNRVDLDTLRITCKKYNESIPSQDQLNILCIEAHKEMNLEKVNHLRQQGAFLSINEEIYELFNKKERKISRLLLHTYKTETYETILHYGIIANNSLFIEWLLKELKPLYNGRLLTKSIDFAQNQDCHKITQMLEHYKRDNTPRINDYYYARWAGDWCP